MSAPPEPGAIGADVLVLPERCYRCGAVTRSIVGCLVSSDLTEDPDGFVDFEEVAELIASRAVPQRLERCGIGPIKFRRSRMRPEGYLSNGCVECDAIQGWFPLHEQLMEFLAEGGEYEQLIAAKVSLSSSALRAAAPDREQPRLGRSATVRSAGRHPSLGWLST